MRQAQSAVVALGASLLLALGACTAVAPTRPIVSVPIGSAVGASELARRAVAAQTAWTYVLNATDSTTGLAKAVYTFQPVSVWDIASLIGATWSAHELGLVGDSIYARRIGAVLGTLERAPLFQGAVFNKFYAANTGRMVDRGFQPTTAGYGFSAIDVGRLLVWLRILAVTQPQYAARAAALVARVDMSRIVKNGNLEAMDLDPRTGAPRYYVEAGVGYAQYAAAGYALWGHRAASALDANANARVVDILGVNVLVDTRGWPRLTSEPYLMLGLETGWYSPAIRTQALAVLAAQQARYDRGGIITMVTEDHLPDAPYYFYYYSLWHDGTAFVVEGPNDGSAVERPRWVSTKAAFAWHALAPTPYTRLALDAVQPSAIPGLGWGAGVYENGGGPTGEANLNTAGLVLEALAYQARGRPFLNQPIQ